MTDISRLWFARLYARLGLPFWMGAVLIGCGPYVIVRLISYQASPKGLDPATLSYVFGWAGIIFGAQYGCRHMVVTVSHLRERVQPLGDVPIFSLGFLRVVWLIMGLSMVTGVVIAAIAFPPIPGEPSWSRLLREISLTYGELWLLQFIGLFGWVSAYFTRIPVSKLKLKSFAEDSLLGLKPFGTIAVTLAGMASLFLWSIILISTIPLILELPPAPLDFIIFQIAFSIAIWLATIPLIMRYLRDCHHVMQREKTEKLEWVRSLYRKRLEQINSSTGSIESELAQIAGLGKLQADIEKIRVWPLDLRLLARIFGAFVLIVGLVSSLLTLIPKGLIGF